MKGTELKILRIMRGIKAQELAKRLGVSPGRLSQIEGSDSGEVSNGWVDRYLKALSRDYSVQANLAGVKEKEV